jgi:hypothetical protein
VGRRGDLEEVGGVNEMAVVDGSDVDADAVDDAGEGRNGRSCQ